MAELTGAAIDAAIRRGEEERADSPFASSVRYDQPSGRIIVEFANGAAFLVPARSLQDLAEARDEDLADVELAGETGIRWERLDVDLTIKGLMAGIFGTAKFMDGARRGGRSRSEAKIAPSRTDGAKGGRPAKRR